MLSEDKKIKTKAQLKEYLDAELVRYPLKGRRYLFYFLQASEGAILHRHTVLLRKTEYYINTGRRFLGFWYYARLKFVQNKYCIHIPINSCGKGLSIPHVLPLAMNGDVTLGENCRIHGFSTLTGDGANGAVPTLGNNVTIGMSVTIVGGVTLADDITIGAGAVVTKSFLEPGITIAGVPAKKISDVNSTF